MRMDEAAARRVILAHAIETVDTQGTLLSEVERDQIDRQARQEAGADGAEPSAVSPVRFLDLRARHVLHAVEQRNPAVAELQDPWPWQRWLAAGLPVGAMVLGVLTDVIANPHRVDLVSLPLLGLVLWNLFMYLLLLAGWALAQRRPERPAAEAPRRRADSLLRWRRGFGNVRADVTALFQLRWQVAARALTLQRWKRVLHLSAAGWAVGVSLSLLMRGLVVEYRVGWESTFLDAAQVHAILSFLRLPALLVFPFQPFSVQEVASLQFSQGGGAIGGARWVYMYVALLLVVVVVPRLLLAAAAFWHERTLNRQVPVDARDPYYKRVVSLLSTSRVQLSLLTHRPEDKAALARVLVQEPEAGRTLITSPQGDVLRMVDLSGSQVPAPPPPGGSAVADWTPRWMKSLLGQPRADAAIDPTLAAAREEGNVVLHVVGTSGDMQAALPLLEWLGRPVLVLVNRPDVAQADGPGLLAQCEAQARQQPLAATVLSFDAFARCWIQERVLLGAVGAALPESARAGFERIAVAWDRRNLTRFGRSMAAVAEHLLYAARQVQEVQGASLSVKSLLPGERQAQAQARQAAMNEVVKRLHVSAGELFSRLRVLHGIDEAAAGALQHRLQEKFVVQQAVDTPQAGMAGAATGAAMGASVDLLVGGLTLGAATALGALVGGGAAYIAAAWKNRATSAGSTVVQLSDEMIQAIAEAALLRYLAVAHYGRGAAGSADELTPFWTADVVAAVEAHRDRLTPFWVAARTQPDPGKLVAALGGELEATAREVLDRLYPARAGARGAGRLVGQAQPQRREYSRQPDSKERTWPFLMPNPGM
jgi:hypothetical protein